MGHVFVLTLLSVLQAMVLSSCAHFVQADAHTRVEVRTEVHEDREYLAAVDQVTRKALVFKNFESVVAVHATYYSKDFWKFWRARHEALYGETVYIEPEDAFTYTVFFVSLSSPDTKHMDLKDANIWQLTLESTPTSLKSVRVKALKNKERWKAMFPYVTPWSQEYMVWMPAYPQKDSASPMTLALKSSLAGLSMEWP